MTIFHAPSLADLAHVPNEAAFGLVQRPVPEANDAFFHALTQQPFRLSGTVTLRDMDRDIRRMTDPIVPTELRTHSVYELWVSDMIAVSRSVCQMLRTDQVRFRLDSHRGCRRYHQDNIAVRTVVTYYGQGTEYLLRENVDWEAYKDGMDNDRIVIDRSDIRFIETWDVAAIRGGPGGLMHKTPEVALDQPSVFLRVDPIDARLV